MEGHQSRIVKRSLRRAKSGAIGRTLILTCIGAMILIRSDVLHPSTALAWGACCFVLIVTLSVMAAHHDWGGAKGQAGRWIIKTRSERPQRAICLAGTVYTVELSRPLVLVLRYRDPGGKFTNRHIRWLGAEGHYEGKRELHIIRFHAFCFLRKEHRVFRVDRVELIADPDTGVITNDLIALATHHHIRFLPTNWEWHHIEPDC